MPCVHDLGIVEDVSALPEDIDYEPERYGCVWIDKEHAASREMTREEFIKLADLCREPAAELIDIALKGA